MGPSSFIAGSLASQVSDDLRRFSSSFDAYVRETGAWPEEVDPGVIPPGMASRLNPAAWIRRTPIGGQFNWDQNQTHYGTKYLAVIAISSSAKERLKQDVELWQTIDDLIDDGNLETGTFRIETDDEPIYVVTQ